jgi:hypothetical protein
MKNENNLTDHSEKTVVAPLDPAEFFKGFVAGLITAVVFGLGGFLLLYDRSGSMGVVLFILLPIATGFATALVARLLSILLASLLLGLLICTVVLLVTGSEGFVCVLMSAPLIAIGMAIGALIGSLFRVYVLARFRKPRVPMMLVLLVLPVFLMGADSAEQESRRTLRAETITDTLIVSQSPETVWNELKNMDNVAASKGFLMKIGLPVPVSCKTEGEGVGGKRTCYFESGYIEERITEWSSPNSMKFEITASDVPGRPWLTFRDASYQIKREGDHTIVTRSTTIVSRLSPAWYWRRLEAIGVHTEHRYLFEAVENNFKAVR